MTKKNKPIQSKPTTPQTLKIDDAQNAKLILDNAVQIAELAANILIVAEELRIKTKIVDTFVPGNLERTVFSTLPTVPAKIRKKMRLGEIGITAAEVAGMIMVAAEAMTDAQPNQQVSLLMVSKSLIDSLQKWITETGESKLDKKSKSSTVYQFKITLIRSNPLIWRRIHIQDCTLDELHEHIQTAMGWTNCHLHQFFVDGYYYGDPELVGEMGDIEMKDSMATMFSEILPAKRKRFQFLYEYDFADGWQHEVLFEGNPKPEEGTKYPLCLEGERACPPEDVGGFGGYAKFLQAALDPKHENHKAMLKWAGGKFDPEKFDPAKATKAMKKGLPDWQNDEEYF